MKAGSSVQPSPSITSTPAGASSAVAERGDLAAAHEHVEARVDALAGIEHARAAHEHVGARPGGLDQPPWLASAHAAASPPASTS